jgi:two-component system chemotaxis sensor kinase CheA
VTATVKVDTRKLDHLVDMIGELVIAQAILQEDVASRDPDAERLGRHLTGMRRVTADLQRTALALRMVPIGQTFQKMARLVRDVAHR